MSSNIASRRYAKALLDVAEEGDYVDQMAEDLVVVSETVAGSRDLLNMLRSPIVKGDLKARILKEVFKDAVSDKTIRLFDLLCRKKRAGLLADVIEDFSALRDVRGGIVNVDVTSAVKLNDEQSQKLINGLSVYTGKKVRARLSLDEHLIGGVKVQIGDTILDNTVVHQLERLKHALGEEA